MRGRWSARALVAGALLGGASSAYATPNLLVIIADDLGVDKVRSYSDDVPGYRAAAHHLPRTTVIDELAASGIRFTDAWASPLCSPTRAGILTGRQPFRTGVGAPVGSAPPLDLTAETTLPELLSDPSLAPTPYATGLFGKWHLGSTGSAGNTSWTLSTADGGHREVYEDAHPILAGFDTYAGWLYAAVPDYFDWTRVYSDGSGVTTIDERTDYTTWATTDDALTWINAQGGPWFAVVAYNATHDAGGRAYSADDSDPSCHQVACLADGTCRAPETAAYQALAECLDTGIGDLLEGISPATMRDTLIVFVGDNGTEQQVQEGWFARTSGEVVAGKGTVYENGIRVPLLVADGAAWLAWHRCVPLARRNGTCALPERVVHAPGRVVDTPVLTVDLFATLTDVASVSQTTGEDSWSLTDCLTNPDPACAAGAPRPLYTETFEYASDGVGGWTDELAHAGAALRDGDDKLVITWDPAAGCLETSLYDLPADRFELLDLAHARPARLADLKAIVEGIGPPWLLAQPWCEG